jgi:hypothetical protein
VGVKKRGFPFELHMALTTVFCATALASEFDVGDTAICHRQTDSEQSYQSERKQQSATISGYQF